MRKWILVWAVIIAFPWGAHAHLGPKTTRLIEWSNSPQPVQRVLIDNLGLFVGAGERYEWTCDEALTPYPGLNAFAAVGESRNTWLIGTRSGLRRTDTDRCAAFEPTAPLDRHVISQLLPHPERPDEVLATTQTLGIENEVFLSEDGGETWTAAGLATTGRIRRILRAPSDADRIYVVTANGGFTSVDGGRRFNPFNLGPVGAEVDAVSFDLLAVAPSDPLSVYAAYVNFPESALLASNDGGQSWSTLFTLEDIPDSLAVDADRQFMLISSPIMGLHRSLDGGANWTSLGRAVNPGALSCLTFGPDGALWACGLETETAVLLRSTDDGDTWKPRLDLELSQADKRTECGSEQEFEQRCEFVCELYPGTCANLEEMDASPPSVVDASGSMTTRSNHGTGGCVMSYGEGVNTSTLILFFLLLSLRHRNRR